MSFRCRLVRKGIFVFLMLRCFRDRRSATWTNHIVFLLQAVLHTQRAPERTVGDGICAARASPTSGRLGASLLSFSCLHVPSRFARPSSQSFPQECFMRASCLSLAARNCNTTAGYRNTRPSEDATKHRALARILSRLVFCIALVWCARPMREIWSEAPWFSRSCFTKRAYARGVADSSKTATLSR